jgi:hypothetical protein
MLINSPNISGSLTVTGNTVITGSLTVLGGINATITGSATSASYVEYSNVANKPALVSSSAQIVGYNIFATTGSNQFNGSQAITGSLTVTGQVVAQTLNVQQVTSSIVYSSGSNIFGNSLSNTQQFTGSVSVTGSLTVNGTSAVTGTGTTNYLPKFTGASTIGNSTITDNGTTVSVLNSAYTDVLRVGSTSNSIYFYPDGGSVNIMTGTGFSGTGITFASGSNYLDFNTNSLTRMRITSGGNIGIGTTSPIGPLDIAVPATGSAIAATTSQQAYNFSRFRIKHYTDSNLGLSIGYAGANFTYIQA